MGVSLILNTLFLVLNYYFFIMINYEFATLTRLDLEIMDTQNKIKYIKLPTRKPRKSESNINTN